MGVPKDEAEAVRWFRKAAEQGDADAQRSLGAMYDTGKGVPEDVPRRCAGTARRPSRGNATAQLFLGLRYDIGEGAPEDDAAASRCSARQRAGEATAQFILGLRYASGEGVPKDEAEAVRWFRRQPSRAALLRSPPSGPGTPPGGCAQGFRARSQWWNIAGANGDEEAREIRDDLEGDMTRAEIRRATEWRALAWTRTIRTACSNEQLARVEAEVLTESGARLRSGVRSTPQRWSPGLFRLRTGRQYCNKSPCALPSGMNSCGRALM